MPTLVERCGSLFPTSVVGSLPRPEYVREIVVDGRRDEGWKGRLDAAVAHAVSVQEAAGLDVISDGEWAGGLPTSASSPSWPTGSR